MFGALCVAGASILAACSGGGGDTGDASFSDAGLDDAASELSAEMRAAGLTTFASALDVVDVEQLVGASEFTLLVPSDVAFQSMDPDDLGDLLADPTNLLSVLRNHVIEEQLDSAELAARSSVVTQFGSELVVAEAGGALTIGGASVSSIDLPVDNGTVHVVDQVFVP